MKQYYGKEARYFRMVYGFVTLDVNKDRIVYDFFNSDPSLLYTYTRTKQ